MYKKETKQRLCELLISFGEEEKEIEDFREALCLIPEFEPYLAFKYIDEENKKFINSENIVEFLSKYSIFHSEKNAFLYINHYDQDIDAQLSYLEFLNSILPQDNPDLRKDISLKNSLIERTEINNEALEKLASLLDLEIQFYLKFEVQKVNLLNCTDFTAEIGFSDITNKREDHINFKNLKEFFIKNDFNLHDVDILLIMRRIDLEGDGKISKECFKFAITPKLSLYDKKNTTLEQVSENFMKTRENLNEGLKNTSKVQDLIKIIGKNKYTHCNSCYPNPKNIENYGLLEPSGNRKLFSFQSIYGKRLEEQDMQNLIELSKILKILIKNEKNLEEAKKNLAMTKDFNFIDLFKFFDRNNQGFLMKRELEDVLNEIGLSPSKNELFLFFRNYDLDCDGRLKYSDFIEAFKPKQQEYFKLVSKNASNIALIKEKVFTNIFCKETRRMIRALFQDHFDSEILLEIMKKEVMQRGESFNLQKIFNILDRDSDGYINQNDLKNLMNACDNVVLEKEIRILFDRFDKDQDSLISFSEFIFEIEPKKNE